MPVTPQAWSPLLLVRREARRASAPARRRAPSTSWSAPTAASLRSGPSLAAPEGTRRSIAGDGAFGLAGLGRSARPCLVRRHRHLDPAVASAASSAASPPSSTRARPARPISTAFANSSSSPPRERIKAFLNIGSIGLVACNRVSELIDIRSIDIDRTLACVEANRDVIVGIKVRASHVILGSWGITPVKVAQEGRARS